MGWFLSRYSLCLTWAHGMDASIGSVSSKNGSAFLRPQRPQRPQWRRQVDVTPFPEYRSVAGIVRKRTGRLASGSGVLRPTTSALRPKQKLLLNNSLRRILAVFGRIGLKHTGKF